MKIAKIRNEMSLCLVDISQKQKQFENSLKNSGNHFIRNSMEK